MKKPATKSSKKRTPRKHIEYRDVTLQEFLGLSDAENELIELKFRLSKALQTVRQAKGVTEKQLAERMRTRQPAVNRMFNAADKVSLDTLVTGFLALGANRREIAKLIAG